MKKTLLVKNLKFAILVAMCVAAGIQTGQAVSIGCPDSKDINEEEVGPLWKYAATTTGAKAIPLHKWQRWQEVSLHAKQHPRAVILLDELNCNYGQGEHFVEFILRSAKIQNCKAVDKYNQELPEGEYGVAFKCK